jgi:DNA polymerase-3 subunit gamma/tau
MSDSKTTKKAATTAAGTHYKVLARRWRPQQFGDLVGQEAIAQALQGAINAQRVAHAYLFTGARGVGKTTTARILAKALNCKKGPTTTPCDECDSCECITSGDDVDVIEIDGASNRGIDEVRELRQNVNLRATRGRYKIYIIDEVHMLTREAFNALLKTLEEPPEHVKFIFATTDPQKIPITILSRCQRFDFGTIANERIRGRLEEIVKQEGIAVEPQVLELVTRRAAGSMRDALSLMDQLLAFGGEAVTADQVHRLLGTASEDRLMELARSLIERDAGKAIDLVSDAEARGVQLGELIDQLIEYFRDLMILKTAGPEARLLSVSSTQRRAVAEQAGRLALDFIFSATDLLAETKSRLRGNTAGRVLLDVALARIASLEDLQTLDELAARLASIESSLGRGQASPRAAAPTGESNPPESKKKAEPARDDPPVRVPAAITPTIERPSSAPMPDACDDSASDVAGAGDVLTKGVALTAERATRLLASVSQTFGPVLRESISRATVSVSSDPETLVVGLDPMYNSRMQEIESALQERIGSAIRVRVQSGTVTPAAPHAAAPRRASYSERLSEVTRDPLVQQVIDLFEARVIRIEEN